MIVCLTLNPAFDVTYTLPEVRLGESHRVGDVVEQAGGKGVNVARVLVAQGFEAHVVAPVGGPGVAAFAADLERAGIRHHLVEGSAPIRRTLAVVAPGSTTNLNEDGRALTAADEARLLAALERILDERDAAPAADGARPTVLVVSGSVPAGTAPGCVAALVEAGRARGVIVVVDTSGPFLEAALDAGADVVKPNHHELAAVTGSDDVVAGARRLAARSGGLVLASLGEDGLAAVRGEGPVVRAAPRHAVSGNTTGAGDAVVASIVASLVRAEHRDPLDVLRGGDLDATLRRAATWAAAAVLAPVAGALSTLEALDALEERLGIRTWTEHP